MKRQLGLLLGGALAFWVAAGSVAGLLGFDHAVLYSGLAVALCLVPTLATLTWAGWAADRSPEQQLLMVVGGTGVRMAFVLGAGLVLYLWVLESPQQSFWIWVLAFYLVTLALEIGLLLVERSRVSQT